jgi:hypothetical protein
MCYFRHLMVRARDILGRRDPVETWYVPPQIGRLPSAQSTLYLICFRRNGNGTVQRVGSLKLQVIAGAAAAKSRKTHDDVRTSGAVQRICVLGAALGPCAPGEANQGGSRVASRLRPVLGTLLDARGLKIALSAGIVTSQLSGNPSRHGCNASRKSADESEQRHRAPDSASQFRRSPRSERNRAPKQWAKEASIPGHDTQG